MKSKHPSEEEIRKRAREIYLEHGRKPGHDIDNWLQAEYELTRLPSHKHPKYESASRKEK